jgi:hypothetical protein
VTGSFREKIAFFGDLLVRAASGLDVEDAIVEILRNRR